MSGLSHGSGDASANTASGHASATGGQAQGAEDGDGGGILATIGSYLGMGGGDGDTQEASSAAGDHPQQQGKPGGTGGMGTTGGGSGSTSVARGASSGQQHLQQAPSLP